MLYSWKIKAYAYLVKAGRYNLDVVENNKNPLVEGSYRTAVAEYLISGML